MSVGIYLLIIPASSISVLETLGSNLANSCRSAPSSRWIAAITARSARRGPCDIDIAESITVISDRIRSLMSSFCGKKRWRRDAPPAGRNTRYRERLPGARLCRSSDGGKEAGAATRIMARLIPPSPPFFRGCASGRLLESRKHLGMHFHEAHVAPIK